MAGFWGSAYNAFVNVSSALEGGHHNMPNFLGRRDAFRRFLGEHQGGRDPFITGFGIVFFTKMPEALADTNNYKGSWLSAMCTSFELPDLTIDSIDYEGRDGGQWHVPGAAKMGNDLTMNLWEMDTAPTYRILAEWIQLMRNPHYGFMSNTTWKQQNYKGQIAYAACLPDLSVRFVKVYNGVWPTELKDSAFKYDNNQDKVEFSCSFKFDHYPYCTPEIHNAVEQRVKDLHSDITKSVQAQYNHGKETIKGANIAAAVENLL